MSNKIKRFLHSALVFLFPDRCPYCHRIVEKDDYACAKCKKDIENLGISLGIPGGYRCCSALPHESKYRYAVLKFKFNHRKQYSKQFARLIYKQITESYPDMIFDYITYVPMHKSAIKKRGYNQCELLAKDLSKLLNVPCADVLEKVKKTKPQHELSGKDRRTNLIGAFKVTDKSKVKSRSILLIDDIVTTGSTLGECAKMLSKENPALICCATFTCAKRSY